MTRTRPLPPRTVRVRYCGQEYDRDLAMCRRELLNREVDGDFENVVGLARHVYLSAGTVHHFLSGREQCSREAVERILGKLHLSWDDVHSAVPPTPGALAALADGRRSLKNWAEAEE